MAAVGGTVTATAVSAAQVDTAAINVTGTDLAMCGVISEDGSPSPVLTLTWDPTGNNEAFTMETAQTVGTFLDHRAGRLDDPTAANAVVRGSTGYGTIDDLSVGIIWFTGAGAISDYTVDDNFTTSTPSMTVPNVVTGDIVVDFLTACGTAPPTLAPGANQTEEIESAVGNYMTIGISTQAGADGGVMSWTITGNLDYGEILSGYRIPDAGGGALTTSGTPAVDALSASAQASQILRPSGTPSIDVLTSSGVASLPASVVITDVDTDETWTDGDTGLVITGSGFL